MWGLAVPVPGSGETSTSVPGSVAVCWSVAGRHEGETPPLRRGARARQQRQAGGVEHDRRHAPCERGDPQDDESDSGACANTEQPMRALVAPASVEPGRMPHRVREQRAHWVPRRGCIVGAPRRLLYFAPVAASADALRVVIADDHQLFREGLKGMLQDAGMEVVGEAADGADAAALVEELQPAGGGARPEHAGHLGPAGAAADRAQQPGHPNGGADGVRRGRRRGRGAGGGGVRLPAEGHPRGSSGGRHQAGGGGAHGDLGRRGEGAGRARARRGEADAQAAPTDASAGPDGTSATGVAAAVGRRRSRSARR